MIDLGLLDHLEQIQLKIPLDDESREAHRALVRLMDNIRAHLGRNKPFIQYDRWINDMGSLIACDKRGDILFFSKDEAEQLPETPIHVTVTITRKGDE